MDRLPDIFANLPNLSREALMVISLCLSLILAIALYRVLWSIMDHATRPEQVVARQILNRVRPLMRAGFLLLAVAFFTESNTLPGGLATGLNRIMLAGITLIPGWGIILASNVAIERYIRRFDLSAENNLAARKTITQMRLLRRTLDIAIAIITIAFALMQFDSVRQYGVSIFASAGVAGLAIGIAARPLLENLIAGVQIALTQPIRLDDVVIVEGEWGRVESFSATYVVICIWDQRRLIVPLSYFLSKPFQNWTHTSSDLLGTVYLYTDYTVSVAAVREKFLALVETSALWDKRVAGVQVTNTSDKSMELRCLMSAANSSALWDLRCEMREKMLDWLQQSYPAALPRIRAELQPQPGG